MEIEKVKSNKAFKVIIILLSIILIASMAYIFKMSDRQKNIILKLRSEKLEILTDLEKSKIRLDSIISTRQNVSKELLNERKKVQQLLIQLKKTQNGTNNEEATIIAFQNQARKLQSQILELTKEVEKYKRKADSTSVALSKTNVILNETILSKDTLFNKNKKLTEKLSIASKLTYFNLKTNTVKVRKSGKEIETQNASSVDLIKITFQVAENKLAISENKKYYFQIIDSKNNIVGSKKEVQFGNQTLPYSDEETINYAKKAISIKKDIPVYDLKKGSYFINVFEKNNLILKNSLDLN